MRKKLIVLAFFTFCTISYGQVISEKNLIGKWTVREMIPPKINLPEDAMKEMIEMKKTFHNSTFEFRKNGQFFLSFLYETSYSNELKKKLNEKKWKLDLEEELIYIVDTDKEESQIMFITFLNLWSTTAEFQFAGVFRLIMKKEKVISEKK